MASKSENKRALQKKPKGKKFYIITYRLGEKRPDFEIENLDALLGRALILQPPRGKRGFPTYTGNPKVVIGKVKKGRRATSDVELFHSYWLISARLKSVFEAIDPSAFAFQECDVRFEDGSAGPDYWLCDVVRVRDAFAGKTLRGLREHRKRTGLTSIGLLSGRASLDFDEADIGEAHIFRTPFSKNDIFCDEVMKDACRTENIKGLEFFKCFS